ncbi:MAG: hypothetical protein WCA82_09445 [Jiangellales bacterium]
MRRTIALLSVPALVAGGMLFTAGPSTAQNGVDLGGLPDGGTVTIQTGFPGGAGKVTTVLKDAAGDDRAPVVQDVSSNSCDALSDGLVEITASGEACYGNLGFGVDPGREGLPWFQNFLNPNIEAGETLTISAPDLGSDAPRDYLFFGDVSLDIEALRTGGGPDIQLTTYLGESLLETQSLDLTERVLNWPPNYRVGATLTRAADRIELTALGNTRFQLEGDTDNKLGSTFDLAQVTDVLDCEGGSQTLPNGAVLTVNGGDGCTDEPIVFDVNADGDLLLLKEPSEAEYTLVVPFVPSDTNDPLARVQIDYDAIGEDFVDVLDCTGSTDDPALAADANPATPIVDGFCEAGRTTTLNEGAWTVQVKLFGVNDPKFRYR